MLDSIIEDMKMCRQPLNLPEKKRKIYQPPELSKIQDPDIESGDTEVPENNNGLLES